VFGSIDRRPALVIIGIAPVDVWSATQFPNPKRALRSQLRLTACARNISMPNIANFHAILAGTVSSTSLHPHSCRVRAVLASRCLQCSVVALAAVPPSGWIKMIKAWVYSFTLAKCTS
jgi:hypothetical protein